MNFKRTLLVCSLAIVFASLPIVRAKGGKHGRGKHCGKEPCHASKEEYKTPCPPQTHIVCVASSCSTVTTLTTTAPLQTITQTGCCTPFETASLFPSMLCSTVVMCGATDANCAGERVSKFNRIANAMIIDSSAAQIYVNDVLTTIEGAAESASLTTGTSVVTLQNVNAAASVAGGANGLWIGVGTGIVVLLAVALLA